MRTVLKVGVTAVAVVVSLILIAVAAIYFWPHESGELQAGTRETVSYAEALERVESQQQRDLDNSVTPECQSTLMTHGDRAEGAVVFLHGIRVCPSQFNELATYFFEQGYNVYIPVAPAHGTAVNQDHANVKAEELVDYLNESVTIATGLGGEVGVVGLSGGAALGTWAAHYRPEVERLLLLSAFYEPSTGHAPSWQLPFLKTLYGYHLLPDLFSTTTDPAAPGFSYRALAQYLILGDNYREDPTGLALKVWERSSPRMTCTLIRSWRNPFPGHWRRPMVWSSWCTTSRRSGRRIMRSSMTPPRPSRITVMNFSSCISISMRGDRVLLAEWVATLVDHEHFQILRCLDGGQRYSA